MIIQKKDTYTWAALYDDGTYVGEYDRPEGRGFAEVDSARVRKIKLESPDMALRSHYVEIPQGAEVVFFRRRQLTINVTDETTVPSTAAHCIGWKRGDEAVYLFVFDNGDTLLTNDLQAV